MPERLEIIRKIINRNYRTQIIVGVVLVLSGSILMFSSYIWSGIERNMLVIGLGWAIAIVGLILSFYSLSKYLSRKNELIEILKNEPQRVVWVYHYIVQNMPYGVAVAQMVTIYFNLINEEQLSIRVKQKEALKILDMLKLELPHATFGYSKEKEQLYAISPNLLIRE